MPCLLSHVPTENMCPASHFVHSNLTLSAPHAILIPGYPGQDGREVWDQTLLCQICAIICLIFCFGLNRSYDQKHGQLSHCCFLRTRPEYFCFCWGGTFFSTMDLFCLLLFFCFCWSAQSSSFLAESHALYCALLWLRSTSLQFSFLVTFRISWI